MKKYNEVVEYHKQGMEKCDKVVEEQNALVEKAQAEAEEVINGALKAFTDVLEEKVKQWTEEDYKQFIEMAENDIRVDSKGILTISTAYSKTHPGSEELVHNVVVKKALVELALDNVAGAIIAIGL